MNLLVGAIGCLAVIITVSDIFQSVIVPRPVNYLRPSALLSRTGWRIVSHLSDRIGSPERREALLGVYAPALVVTLLVMWVAALVLGFGAIFYAIRAQLHPEPANYWGAAYYAGTSLLTLGFGDITAGSGLTRLLSLVAAALGLGTFAVVISFLFLVFGAFQRREAFIVTLRERTGAPPSGVAFLVNHAELRMLDAVGATFKDAESWIAEVMETHLAFPILVYFRSTHDAQSWIGTLGALLDASSLILTAVDTAEIGPARMLNRLGRHLVNDFNRNFHLDGSEQPGIDRHEFANAYRHLRDAGIPLREEDAAWLKFAALRATYAGPLNASAKFFRIPPAQWIGDRSFLPVRHMPQAPHPVAVTANVADADAPARTV